MWVYRRDGSMWAKLDGVYSEGVPASVVMRVLASVLCCGNSNTCDMAVVARAWE
jgi:hypothetical protein